MSGETYSLPEGSDQIRLLIVRSIYRETIYQPGSPQSNRAYAAASPQTSASLRSISWFNLSTPLPTRYAPGPKAAFCAKDEGNSPGR